MPTKSEFILKDSPQDVIAAFPDVIPKGRSYDGEIAKKKAGAARINEILLGTKLACIAITDDKEGTLAKVSKLNPWHEVALTTITGSLEEAHKPLTHILDKHFGLKLDHQIDISKMAGGMHSVDTQGYIAHNDDIIVVSFRCTTSAFDWMSNLSIVSSEWELDEDLAQGHSGFCSCFDGRFGHLFCGGTKKPRVHTGFYNNILQVIPLLQKYIDPLLKADQAPRTLYVVGHSLGAGVSTLATCYFLLSHDWATLPQRLLNISAGTPRACGSSMAAVVEEELATLTPLEKAAIFRIVMDQDAVCMVPPEKSGYLHVGRSIFLTEDGEVLVNPKSRVKARELSSIVEGEMKEMKDNNPSAPAHLETEEGKEEIDNAGYQKMVAKIPKPFRDHCPDCYLEPLMRLYEREDKDN
ncbi:hypothetical protein ACHAXR_004708 [Thalassiosira sp. AJA248-18]